MFDEIGGYDENYKYAQDYKFFIDAKLKGYKIFTIDTPLYYLNTKNNISNNYYEENYDELVSAKNVVLEKFNLIKRIDKIVEERLAQPDTQNLHLDISIYPKFHYEGKNMISRLLFALNKRIKRLSNYLEKFYS